MKKGIFYGIGVGPGDPELVTLKAIRYMKDSDVLALPQKEKENCMAYQIAVQAVPELAEKPVLPVDMPMIMDQEKLNRAFQEGADRLCALLAEGKNVAFLTIGDPGIYSTYFNLHDRVIAAGYESAVVPGIPSFCAAAAALKTPLCLGKDELHIIPRAGTGSKALDYPGVKVLMRSKFPDIFKELDARKATVQMAENCTLPTEKLYPNRESLPENAGYFSLMIVREDET